MPVSPPRPVLPSLNALRAFEAAARLGGFTRAAEELNVTPGAVANHVKTLEDWAGAALFTRHPQGLTLTEEAALALAPLTAAFDAMGIAVQALRASTRPERLHIAALPAVAQLWLMPILPRLRAELPGHEVSVSALETPPNLAREGFDLALFYAEEGGEPLEKDEIFPVCAPRIAKHLHTPEDLAEIHCLRDSTWADDWQRWGAAARPGAPFRPRGPVFSLYAMAVDEAVDGAGVLMAHGALVRRHLDSGRLVAPLPTRVPTGRALRLFLRPGPITPALDRLCALLRAESRL